IKCGGASSKDTVFVTGGTPPYLYSVNNGTFQTSRYFALKAGSYIFTVKDSKGCLYSTTTLVKTQPAPVAVTLVSKSNPTCIGASDGVIKVSASGGSSPYLYQLNSGAFQVSGQFSHLPAGSYAITAKDAVGCLRTYNVTLVASTTACASAISEGVAPTEFYSAMTIAPNPSRSDFMVSFFSRTTSPREMRVYDISGKVVYQRLVSNYQYIRFGAELEKGVYILQVTENGKTAQTKLVKQ
ncbi:MAG TPA: T9SS type A sorting domain-containing protein, partial [Flavitalea sp.]|nr:T9SS type A sorting domain-containing protein [Flavitalea sp.]